MQTQITGHNLEITNAIRDYTEKKMKHLTNHSYKMTNVHFTYETDKLRQIAKATINVPGSTIHAQAESEDLYKSIDSLIDKLQNQLDKRKKKEEERH